MFKYLTSWFQTPELPSHIIPKLNETIQSSKVVVFSKSYCPYCDQTKALLGGLKQEFTSVELDHDSEGAAKQQGLKEITGQRTVPNVFINGKHIGGNDALQALKGLGKLKGLLA